MIRMGVVVKHVAGTEDRVVVTDGVFTVHAYIPNNVRAVQIGDQVFVHKQGYTHILGAKLKPQGLRSDG
jgi:hypothetical protein